MTAYPDIRRSRPTLVRPGARLLAMIALVGALAVALTVPATALAWQNGKSRSGNGFGTHDWIVLEASSYAAAHGVSWLDTNTALNASDDPDTHVRDQRYHTYDRWGKRSGYADRKVRAWYQQAVASLRAGDTRTASYAVGMMSHYYADACDPLHTDDVAAEKRMHDRYEKAVDARLARPRWNAAWVHYDGYRHVTDPAAATVSAARSSHGSYSKLVNEYNKRRFSSTTSKITQASLSRAVNGLSDLIVSIQEDAAYGGVGPDTAAHQGVATDGSYYYVIHTDWIEKYDLSWRSVDATFSPMYEIEGLTDSFQKHLGSGTCYDGKLYVVAENYPAVTDQHILTFDTSTMERVASVATSQTHEVAAIAAVPDEGANGVLYVASYYDSSRLFRYDLKTQEYLGDLPLFPVPATGFQALAYHNGRFYLGKGNSSGLGLVYVADRAGNTKLVYTSTLPGWHEGFAFLGEKLVWLIDRGWNERRVWTFTLPPH